MSKHDKTLEKLRQRPINAGIKWTELKSLLIFLGYEVLKGKGGSSHKFYNREKDALFMCHKPHPSPDVDKGCANSLSEHLDFYGLLKR